MKVAITDLSGKTLIKKTVTTAQNALLDVSSLSSGVYFISINSGNAHQTKKLMIK